MKWKGKLKGVLYELSSHARIPTKELGKRLKISQQSASYLMRNLQQKGIIQDHSTIIDPAKLGYITVLVYFNYIDLTPKTIEDTITSLKQTDAVVSLAELAQGYDLMALFCVPNLSSFNKIKRDFLQNYHGKISVAETHPVIVRHLYPRKYLATKKPSQEYVISGDREVVAISAMEKQVLFSLWEHPVHSIIDIHLQTKLNPKTIVKIKKRLEEQKVIRGYTTLFDFPQVGIGRQLIQLNSEHLSVEEDRKLLHVAFTHPQIISMTRVIGNFDLLVETEGSEQERSAVLKGLRREFSFHKYKVIDVGRMVKDKFVPRSALQ